MNQKQNNVSQYVIRIKSRGRYFVKCEKFFKKIFERAILVGRIGNNEKIGVEVSKFEYVIHV